MLFRMWLRWMEQRGSHKLIRRLYKPERGEEGWEPYLDRYYLLRFSWRGRPLLGVFLHRFWASDQEGVHDHPWPNASLILAGGYSEQDADGTVRWCPAGAVRCRQAQVFHRLTVPKELSGRTWTLFLHGPRQRPWGFLRGGGWDEADDGGERTSFRGVVFPRRLARS